MAESIRKVLRQPRRPTLARVERDYPEELLYCTGYVWHERTLLGQGSFGRVYLGWNSDGSKEVAVKVVNKSRIALDPKQKENLEREIKLLKLLRGCEYVVHLYHVEVMDKDVVLVMELCDLDLDTLLEHKPLKENDIILFLHQFTQGMKALREQNIVHRDLKPGNILIKRHPTTGKMMIKIADFGYARHFKDENMKPVDLTSMAGTPVFMAPEAHDCIFQRGNVKYYDDKVDIWSIGALLYKIIVGHCGFHAEQDMIGPILAKKGDAIAFTRKTPHTTDADYIYELPSSVNNRLPEPFREKMTKLLQAMLKVDPSERMTFSEFEDAVDDLMTSKIKIINLLHGTTMKVINGPQMTTESLTNEISSCTHVPREHQVLFSNSSKYFISPHTTLSPEHFSQLLEESGGSRGHAKLYLLPVNLVESDTLTPDYSCLAGFVIDDEDMCVSKIVDHKFSDEMVHMVHKMSAQQKSQLEGLNELCKFVSREVTQFGSHSYKQLTEMGHQALAKANLAIQWLQQDLSSLPDQNQGQLGALLQTVNKHKAMIEKFVDQLKGFNSIADISANIDIKEEDLQTSRLTQETKMLPQLGRSEIHGTCKTINKDCQKLIVEVTEKVKGQLHPLGSRLSQVWSFECQITEKLQGACSDLDKALEQVSIERTDILRSSLGLPEIPQGGGLTLPLVNHPSGLSLSSEQLPVPASTVQVSQDSSMTSMVEAVKKENEDLINQVERLTLELKRLGKNSSSYTDEEKTLKAETVDPGGPPSPNDLERTVRPGPTTEGSKINALQTLLEKCCSTAEKLKSGVSGDVSPMPRSPSKPNGESTILFPSFQEGCADVSTGDASSDSGFDTLLPKALQLSENLQAAMERLLDTSGAPAISTNSGLVKIARPSEYKEGDLVLFHPAKLINSKSKVPVMLHLERPLPYVLMDEACYGYFAIRQGRMPDLIIGCLSEKPRMLKFEDHPDLAQDFGRPTNESFFRVKAEATELKFSAPHSTPSKASNLSTSRAELRSSSELGLLNKTDNKYV